MKKRILIIIGSLLSTLIMSFSTGMADVIDQRNPEYQLAVEHLSRAAQLLEKLEAEVIAANKTHDMHGFDYPKLLAELNAVRTTLAPVIYPEQRRLRYRQLTPDGSYFKHSPYQLDGGSNELTKTKK